MSSKMRDLAQRWILPFVDPRQLASALYLPKFFMEFQRYRQMADSHSVKLRDAYPCLSDRVSATPYDPHYFYQDAWLARRIAETEPLIHFDAGSSVVMLSVLSAMVPTIVLDYRPLRALLSNVFAVAGNLTHLPFSDGCLKSVSSLHVVEHIGLGRYGDALDPEGSRSAVKELARVVKPGGRFYLSVPVGRERVCFNAHRVFAPQTILGFAPTLDLVSFALVDDTGRFIKNAPLEAAVGLDYGCGMFEFVKSNA